MGLTLKLSLNLWKSNKTLETVWGELQANLQNNIESKGSNHFNGSQNLKGEIILIIIRNLVVPRRAVVLYYYYLNLCSA